MLNIIEALDEISDIITTKLEENKWVSLCLFILPILLVFMMPIDTPSFIIVPWVILFIDKILKSLCFILKLGHTILKFLLDNHDRIKSTLLFVIVTPVSYLVITAISLFITEAIFKQSDLFPEITNSASREQFLPVFAQFGLSIFILFVLYMIFHLIMIRINDIDWYYQLIDIFLTFSVVVLFAFILGMNSVISDYLDLQWKSSVDLAVLTEFEIEQKSFDYKWQFYMILYWVMSSVLCIQVTFKIANRLRITRVTKI